MNQRINDRVFKGMVPKLGHRHLGEGYCVKALHCDLGSGEIRPVKEDKFLDNVGYGNKTLVNIDGEWLAYQDKLTITKSPVIEDDRYVVSGDGPARYFTANELKVGGAGTLLGVPKPEQPPTITTTIENTATVNLERDFFYVVQYVNVNGDIGDKSDPSGTQVSRNNSSVTLGGLGAFGSIVTDYNVDRQRVYRYFEGRMMQIAELPISQTTFVDTVSDSLLEIEFVGDDYFPPPNDINFLQALSNGVMVGLSGDSDIYLSAAYQIGAYDPSLAFSVPLAIGEVIVSISSYDNTVVILSNQRVHLLVVYSPESINFSTMADRAACVAPRSVVQMRGGVAFATTRGMYFIYGGQGDLLTKQLFDEADWLAQDPGSIHTAFRNEQLIWCYEGGEGGGYILDYAESDPILTEFGEYADLFYVFEGDDALYFVRGQYLYHWRGGSEDIPYIYHSRTFGEASLWSQTAARVLSCSYGNNPSNQTLAEQAEEQAVVQAALAAQNAQLIAVTNLAGGAIGAFTINGGDSLATLGLVDLDGGDANRGIGGSGLVEITSAIASKWFSNLRIIRDCDGADDEDTVNFYSNESERLSFIDRARFVRYELTGITHVSQVDIARSNAELYQ